MTAAFSHRPTLCKGMIVEVILPGAASGQKFVGRRFTLNECSYLHGHWSWRAPDSWSRYMTARVGEQFDLHIQEARLRFLSNGDVGMPGGWEACSWKPHLDVIPDPRNPGLIVNVWDPVGSYSPVGDVKGTRRVYPPPSSEERE